MNATTFDIFAPAAPRLAPAPAKRPRAEHAPIRPKALTRRIALDRGNVLRIHDGQGVRLKATSGVLWITEQDSVEDTVLQPGESYRLKHRGLALALAHRVARVTLAVPAGVSPPGRVDIALADGEPVRRVVLGSSRPFLVAAIVRTIEDSIRRWEADALADRGLFRYY